MAEATARAVGQGESRLHDDRAAGQRRRDRLVQLGRQQRRGRRAREPAALGAELHLIEDQDEVGADRDDAQAGAR